jgi:hypothetical protein
VVERGPEKAGVGGSIPSLATIFFIQILDVFRAALWVLRAHTSIACGLPKGRRRPFDVLFEPQAEFVSFPSLDKRLRNLGAVCLSALVGDRPINQG